jgi:hypothetical protein
MQKEAENEAFSAWDDMVGIVPTHPTLPVTTMLVSE